MRTKTTLLGAAILAAGALSSMAQSNVYSLNIVGYINRSLADNAKFSLVANQLDSGNNTFSNLFATLPANTKILKWTGTSFGSQGRKLSLTVWSPSASAALTLNPGEAAFIQTPPGAVGLSNVFVGNVPGLVATGGTNPVYSTTFTNNWPSGFWMSADQEPEAGTATAVGLTAAIPANAVAPRNTLLQWNEVTQGYNTFTRLGVPSGWSPSIPNLTVGSGYFLNSTAPGSWTHTFNVN